MRVGCGSLLAMLAACALAGAGETLTAQESGTILGAITDSSGNALPNAEIVLPELEIETTSQEDGGFLLPDVPAGVHTIRAHMAGRASVVTLIDVQAGAVSAYTFQLAPLPAVDTASARSETVRATVEIRPEGRSPRSALDLVQDQVAGASVRAGPGGAATIELRGETAVVFVDGVQLSVAGSGLHPLEQIPATAVERIRVLQGPASTVRYSGTGEGVILVETRTGEAEPAP